MPFILKLKNLKILFFSKQAKIYEGNNFSPRIKDNDPLFDEIKNFLTKKNSHIDKYTGINFAENILKILKKIH